VHGGARFGAGLRGVVFHCAKGRGSAVSQQGRKALTRHSSLGGTERSLGNAGRGASASADAIQVFCVCGGSVRSAAVQLYVGDHHCTIISLLWNRIPGNTVWGGCDSVPDAPQAPSDRISDLACNRELCAFPNATQAANAVREHEPASASTSYLSQTSLDMGSQASS